MKLWFSCKLVERWSILKITQFLHKIFFFFVLNSGNKYKIASQRKQKVFMHLLLKQLFLMPCAYRTCKNPSERACLKLCAAPLIGHLLSRHRSTVFLLSKYWCQYLYYFRTLLAALNDLCSMPSFYGFNMLTNLYSCSINVASQFVMLRINPLLRQPKFWQGPYIW